MPKWLKDAVFYEIYPQSFYDTNADGIGDFNGIIEKLDYIRGLGCNALWINPCFDSPFKDAGYDVRDYKKVAPRYGTNDDLVRLFEEAHKRDMHVLLDLVPGHTSEEHEWFCASQKAEKNEYSNRYVWTRSWGESAQGFPYVGGESERSGVYLLNFFKCQPALNYGFYRVDRPWQLPVDHPACIATREAMKDVMRFWLDLGRDGYRVDMAASLVKNDDEKKSGTSAIWKDVRRMLDEEYPEAALVAEWGVPQQSLKAGFHMDFYLNWHLNGYSTLMRDYENHENGENHSYFKKDAGGDINRFLKDYLPQYLDTKEDGYFCLLTGNHETNRPRLARDIPGVPYLCYGDEIGMRYLDLPTKEGGYSRTGSRTPMQWDGSKNLGFSKGDAADLYLPVDPTPDAPTVSGQENDPDSLLNTVKALLALRHREKDLQADAEFSQLQTRIGQPFVYRRGDLVLAINPDGSEKTCTLPAAGEVIFSIGSARAEGRTLTLGAQSFAVIR